MPMDSVSEENVDKLNNEHKDKSEQLEHIKETTIQQMWLSELHNLEKEYTDYKRNRSYLTNTKEKKVISKKKANIILDIV
jgi:ADP-dependent phosphofructokinase/glucokinase